MKEQIRAAGEETVEGQRLLGDLAKNESEVRKVTAAMMKDEAKTAAEKAEEEKKTLAELEKQKAARDELIAKIKLEKAEIEAKVTAEAAATIKGANTAAAAQGFEKLSAQEEAAVKEWIAGGKQGPAPVTRQGNLRDALSSDIETNYLVDGVWRPGRARPTSDFEGASVGAIQEFIRRRETDAAGIRANFGTGEGALVDVVTGGFVRNMALSVIEQEISRARAEIANRRQFDGKDRAQALAAFTGDPLAFDRLYEAAQSQRDEARVTNDLLRRLDDAQRRGLQAISEGLKALPRG